MTTNYIYLGYGITDSNGKAKLEYDAQGNQLLHSYTGTGAGEVDIVASLDSSITDSSLVSEIYELEDCYWIERTSPTSGRYSVSGATLTIVEGAFTFTKDASTSYFYLNIPKTDLPIEDFIGKNLVVKTDITSMTASALRLSLVYHDGTSWGTSITKDMDTTGVMEQNIDIPNNATQVRIRFDLFGNTNDNVVFKDFRFLFG